MDRAYSLHTYHRTHQVERNLPLSANFHDEQNFQRLLHSLDRIPLRVDGRLSML